MRGYIKISFIYEAGLSNERATRIVVSPERRIEGPSGMAMDEFCEYMEINYEMELVSTIPVSISEFNQSRIDMLFRNKNEYPVD